MEDFMSRFRLFLAWLVLAAVPLQGFAAATMLFCGMEQSGHVSKAAELDGHQGHHHGFASAKSGDDHAAHGHGASDELKSNFATDDGAQTGQDQQGHSCPICASCCHLVAVGGFEPLPQVSAPPGVEPVHPTFRVSTRTITLPDKPPRA
jgi:hypothetical protein